ncbi:hypothetical protein NLJ89_g5601 [Agrocybe chaxingu]|uniref:DUF8191 domain-containing protein n=1 Tax=Agrocybe chaxingu TaxID=84603 RepID=A0A9W8JZX8_9AGAR|nr:hypothetical protein NLJ89_g5601 [Agrocybe chaxingu]
MDIEPDELTDPQYTLMRTKSCPSCRAVVKRRPVPVFMVKAIATALRNAKPSSLGLLGSSPTEAVDEDPWNGIFPSSEMDEEDVRDDEDDDSDSESSEVEILTMNPPRYYGRTPFRTIFLDSSDSDRIGEEDGFDSEDDDANENEENESDDEEDDPRRPRYVLPHWTPPTVSVSPEDYDISTDDPPDTLKLLRRGCTMEMLQNYDISYRHSTGIVLYLRSLIHLYASDNEDSEDDGDAEGMHRVYLGWSIKLHPLDVDGEMFVSDLLEDIKTEPERWQLTPRTGYLGKMNVRKLVPVTAVEEYDTTDSELWAGTEDL